jgi:hypothetical protein
MNDDCGGIIAAMVDSRMTIVVESQWWWWIHSGGGGFTRDNCGGCGFPITTAADINLNTTYHFDTMFQC